MELAEIPRLVHHLNGREMSDSEPRYPRVLASLTPDQLKAFGADYLARTRIYRGGATSLNAPTRRSAAHHDGAHQPDHAAAQPGAAPQPGHAVQPVAAATDARLIDTVRPFFIDKMPNNFRHIGLIHLILPNARIIDARREPMACCFSNFKQLFASGQEFTYSLEDIGRYYRSYVELMQHWDAVLPRKILRVQHEDVVANLEGNVRRLLDFCGLDFEPACLEFYKTNRSVRTASSEQVRRPIFKEGLDQWRHFEPWLGPLRSALGF